MTPKLARTIKTLDGTVSVTPFGATVRYHGEGEYGSPFSFVCTVLFVGDEAKLFAGFGKMTPAVWRAISAAMRELGVVEGTFERRNRPRPRSRRVKAPPA